MKLKKGQAVVVTTARTGNKVEGRFVRETQTETGTWVEVNFAPKGKPVQVKKYRPGSVVAL